MAIERLVGHFEAVVDPRCRGKIEHRLTDILVIAVCAVIACAESWNDIALYSHSGVCQRSCPVPHQAASLILRSFVSRSGLRQTSPTGDQLRIWRDHRVGLAARASV